MAKNKDGSRKGAVTDRTQEKVRDVWVKSERSSGKVIGIKRDGTPFKGVTKR